MGEKVFHRTRGKPEHRELENTEKFVAALKRPYEKASGIHTASNAPRQIPTGEALATRL